MSAQVLDEGGHMLHRLFRIENSQIVAYELSGFTLIPQMMKLRAASLAVICHVREVRLAACKQVNGLLIT